jgi:CRP/FNR family cyclic AMP-dependent transcriptional regulator
MSRSHRQEVREGLATVPLFADCSNRDRQIIARHALLVDVPAGMDVVEEGTPGDAFFFVVDGQATVRRKRRKVATLGPGSYFGELALLDPAPRDATVTSDTPMTLGILGPRAFRSLIRELPALNEKLLRSLVRRLREADLRDY